MARLMEASDTDEEFPDIKDVLKSTKGKPKKDVGPREKKSAPRSRPHEVKSLPAEGKGKSISSSKETKSGDDEMMDEELNVPKAIERSVKKKRVLSKRDDNPLLRPIGKIAREERVRNGSSALIDSGKNEALKKTVRGMRAGKEKTVMAASIEPEDEVEFDSKSTILALRRSIDETSGHHLQGETEQERLSLKALYPAQIAQYKAWAVTMESMEGVVGSTGSVTESLAPMKAMLTGTPNEVFWQMHQMEMERGATKPLESIASTRKSPATSTITDLGPGREMLGSVEVPQSVSEREARNTTTGAATGLPAEGSRPSKGLKGRKTLESVSLSGKGKAKSTTINLESDEESLEQTTESEVDTKPQRSRRRRKSPPRTKSKFILTDTEEEDSPVDEDSDGLSDFIVSDNESLEEEDDDSVFEVPPPTTRSARKLFAGRRPKVDESGDESGLDKKMMRLRVDDEDVFGDTEDGKETNVDEDDVYRKKSSTTSRRKLGTKSEVTMKPPPKTKKEAPPASSDVEEPFILRFSPPNNKRKVFKETRFTTPPSSPKLIPRLLPSPSKLPRIPSSPHRQSSDAFWSQDVINDWNDEYSPRKTPKPTLEPLSLGDGKPLFSPRKSPAKPDRLTKDAKKAFAQSRHEMAESFLKELDEKITNGKIAEMAASTGGVKIIWSKKLNTTAGRANWKRETIRPKTTTKSSSPSSGPAPAPTFRHHAAIELAEKVIDDQDRLLNVVAHEFCHLATFMVSDIRTNPHGKEFKAWAAKCSKEFGYRGIEVTTKHSYEIEYKYVWECENCGMEFKRHSKSIDVGKHRCGVCKSKLIQTKPVPRKEGSGGRGLTGYQAFVKEHMKIVRSENPGSPQKEIMGLVGKKYQEYKAAKLKESSVESLDVAVSKEGTPDDDLGTVVRKLDFLDLTSP